MPLKKIAFALLALFVLPAGASAGPIEFKLNPTGFWIEPGSPMLDAALFSTFGPGTFTVDPDTGRAAMTGPLVGFSADRLPQPGPGDLGSSGTGLWQNHGNFRLDFTMTDVETGATKDLSMWGRAHSGALYSNGAWQYGGVGYWFGDGPQYFELGGKDYVIWGQQKFGGEVPEMSVWVGPNPPFPWVPEPGTFALAVLGLAPFGLRKLRKRAQDASAARCSTTSTSNG